MLLLLGGLITSTSSGELVRGISASSFENNDPKFACSWVRPQEYYIKKLNELGFNYLRLPFSAEYINRGDFTGMDETFRLCQQYNLSVLIDYHRTHGSHQGNFDETNLNDFLHVWKKVIDRYKQNDVLQGIGLYNEYQGTDATYWNNIMNVSVMNIEHYTPNRFWYSVGCKRWSGDCSEINLEHLDFRDRIRYEIHKYSFSGSGTKEDWDLSFGPFPEKIIVGEWGYLSENKDQSKWADRFVDYLIQRNIRSSFFWDLAISSDTNGLWKNDCLTLEEEKLKVIKRLWGDEIKPENQWIIDIP